jgi:predicted metal-binding membrane protein
MSATLEHGPAVTAAYAGRRRLPVAVPVAISLAWAAAVAAQATGVAGRFHHDALLGGDTPSLVGVGGYTLAWTVMVTAMMLPSALPLLRLFVETSAGQGRRGRLLACFTAGYLAVWAMFGWAALVFDGGVHGTVDALGCCWAPMLVMFSVGVADLGWMAALAGLMAYEKLGRHGKGAAAAAGVAALALAALVACTRRGCRRSWPVTDEGLAAVAVPAASLRWRGGHGLDHDREGARGGQWAEVMRRIAVDHAASLAGVLGG